MLKDTALIIGLVFTATGCLLLPYSAVMVMITKHAFNFLGVTLIFLWVSLVGYALMYIRKVFSDNPTDRKLAILFMLVLLAVSWVEFAYMSWETDGTVTL
jgi:hypothetical protein